MSRRLARLMAVLAVTGGMVMAGGSPARAGFTPSVPFTVDFSGQSNLLSPPFVFGGQVGSYAFSATHTPPAQECLVDMETAGSTTAGVACSLAASGGYTMFPCEDGTVTGTATLSTFDSTITFSFTATMAGGSGPLQGSWSGGTVTGSLSFVPPSGQTCYVPGGVVTSFTPVGHLQFNWTPL